MLTCDRMCGTDVIEKYGIKILCLRQWIKQGLPIAEKGESSTTTLFDREQVRHWVTENKIKAKRGRSRYILDKNAKRCPGCMEILDRSQFYSDKHAVDGLASACKKCGRARRNKYASTHRESIRQWHRDHYRGNRESEDRNHEKYKKSEKGRARGRLAMAVYRGTIVKPDRCEECGASTEKQKLHGHHEDYTKVFDVKWLCAQCHGRVHTNETPTSC